jgi:PTS system mannose-specific IIC component
MNTLGVAIAIGLVGVFAMLDSRLLGRLNFEQPLITSAIIGVLLGNPAAGLAAGATIELMAMGLVQVGAAVPPDMVMGGIIATTFSILTGADAETAVAIAVPIAVLGQLLGVLFRTLISGLGHEADNAIEQGKFKLATNYHIIWGTILYSLMYFVPIFLAVYLGTDFVQGIVNAIPDWLTNGLDFSAKLLTAYGLALLLSMMVNKSMMPFFLVGFFACAYLSLSVTAIAIFGVLVAIILTGLKFSKNSPYAEKTNEDYDPLEEDD